MAQAKKGDTVKVNYTGKLSDGTVFDSSQGREPLEFTLGEGQLIPGFENAVEGMNPGDTSTVEIPSGKAYGSHDSDMVMVINRNELPPDLEPEVGDMLQMRGPDGSVAVATVTETGDDSITIDANHPLAGKDLTFEIELLEIE